jgi:thymidine kinase
MGGIQLIVGPMFSGKTTELIRVLNRWKIAGRNCVLVKHGSDSRYVDDEDEVLVVSHDGCKVPAVCVEKLAEDGDYLFGSYAVIGIDEGQFVSRYFYDSFLHSYYLQVFFYYLFSPIPVSRNCSFC